MKPCSVPGCAKTHKGTSRGMCWMHYYRERRHGDVETVLNTPDGSSDVELFFGIGWDVDESGCWNWRGAHQDRGYGQFRYHKRTLYAHRFSYRYHYGILPSGLELMEVRHSCDNRSCVNPEHLSIGSHSDNMNDMSVRERHQYGKNAPSKNGEVLRTRTRRR